MQITDGFIQVASIVIAALSSYGVAKFNRAGSKEANQTTGWTNLVAALQKEVNDLNQREDATQAYIKELDKGNSDLARRIYVLERSRHRWKGWGQKVVEIMLGRGVVFPAPPEPLDDTDPNLEKQK